jgi:hypothetical protein
MYIFTTRHVFFFIVLELYTVGKGREKLSLDSISTYSEFSFAGREKILTVIAE